MTTLRDAIDLSAQNKHVEALDALYVTIQLGGADDSMAIETFLATWHAYRLASGVNLVDRAWSESKEE